MVDARFCALVLRTVTTALAAIWHSAPSLPLHMLETENQRRRFSVGTVQDPPTSLTPLGPQSPCTHNMNTYEARRRATAKCTLALRVLRSECAAYRRDTYALRR